MKDKDLDKILETARNQSEEFFNNFNFEQSRKIVLKKIENSNLNKRNFYNRLLENKIFIKGVLATCIIIFVAFISYQIGENNFTKIGTPVLQQVVKLDDNENNHLVNYFRVDNPNKGNNLLAVVWQKDLKGNYQIIYSSILENTDIPNPVTIMNIPFSESKFALVSSSNKDKNFIHYRLIKYNNSNTQTYLEENFVPEGKIEINNGMLIEERATPNDYYLQKGNQEILASNKIYRYFIPIELRKDGGVTLTTNKIRLKKGSILTLLPDDRIMPLDFDYNDEILSIRGNKIYGNEEIGGLVNFETIKEGYVNLKIREKNNIEIVNQLFIEIVD